MVWDVYVHFCTMLIEIIHFPRKLHATTWRRHVELSAAPHGRAACCRVGRC